MPEYFEIKIKGRLDPRWSGWFAGLKVEHLEGEVTLLSGLLPDLGQVRTRAHGSLRTGIHPLPSHS